MYHNNMHIHFVGCTDLGMNGLALLLHFRGFTISGSDVNTDNPMIQELIDRGCSIIKHCHPKNITNADVVVYAPGTSGRHPEIQAARAANITTLTSGQLLAELVRHLFTITVSGIHGKTSTAAIWSCAP